MDELAQFANQQFINVETFRKNGQGVQTPVWFVEDKGTLYVRTVENSFKVKRIRNTPSRARDAVRCARRAERRMGRRSGSLCRSERKQKGE